jgi:hypothetical protein
VARSFFGSPNSPGRVSNRPRNDRLNGYSAILERGRLGRIGRMEYSCSRVFHYREKSLMVCADWNDTFSLSRNVPFRAAHGIEIAPSNPLYSPNYASASGCPIHPPCG